MEASPLALLVVPLVAFVGVLVANRSPLLRACIILAASLLCLGWSVWLLVAGEDQTVAMGGFSAPVGIVLRVDALSRLFVTMNAVVFTLASLALMSRVVAKGGTGERGGDLAYPGILLGLNGLYLTGDFFNLYVFFELMSVSAFLLVSRGARAPVEAGWKFAVQSALASLSLLIVTAFIYGMSGSLDMQIVATTLGRSDAISWTSTLFLFAFLLKGAVFPLHWWQADAHAAAETSGSVVLAGTIINVGIYGVLRIWPLLYGDELLWVLRLVGIASILWGAVAAFGADDVKRLLGYSSTSQLGFALLAAGLSAPGVAVFFLFGHALGKSLLFLVTGAVADQTHAYSLDRLKATQVPNKALGYAYLLGILSLVGFPPAVGFIGKLGVFRAAIDAADAAAVVVLAAGSLSTLAYGMRAYQAMFTGGSIAPEHPGNDGKASTAFMGGAIALAGAAVLVACVFGGELWTLCRSVEGGTPR